MTNLFWTNGEFLSPVLLVVCVVAFFVTAAMVVYFTDKKSSFKCR